MDLKKLKTFIEFMDENNLSELEVAEDKQRIRLKKYQNDPSQISYQMPAQPKPQETGQAKEENLKEIKSPMVGTFYRAASPGAKPYVEVGQTVKKGDVICIIEAMKVMNEIKAETGGKIVEVLPENGQPVEYGENLFTLK